MLTAITLVLIAIIFRVLSPALEIWNFVPMGAVALYAGARLPRRWAWLVPVAAMVLSDLVIDRGAPRPELSRWTIYITFAATTLIGPLANRPKIGKWLLPLLSVSASMLFFVTSNLATWAEGLLYPRTLAGLIECFVAAIPYYGRNTILADLLGTALLFGLGPVFAGIVQHLHRPRLAEVRTEVNATDPPQSARPSH
jgi:hypothetical protein